MSTEQKQPPFTFEQLLDRVKAAGVKVSTPDMALDVDEPLLGRDAWDALDDIMDLGAGTFRLTENGLSNFDLAALAGVDEDNEWCDAAADMFSEAGEYLFEAPDDWEGDTVKFLVFVKQEQGQG